MLTVRNDFTYGNYDLVNDRLIFNVPLFGGGNDTMFGDWNLGNFNTRTALSTLNRDGFVDVAAPPLASGPAGARELDDVDRLAVHHRSRWEVTSRFTIDYIFDHVKADERPTAVQLSATSGLATPPFLGPFVRNTRADNVSQGRGANGVKLHDDLSLSGRTEQII